MKLKQLEKLSDLAVGDIVRNKSASEAMVVTGNYGTHVTAVRTTDISNPSEWLYMPHYEDKKKGNPSRS